jgi:hypothetical protein
MKHDKEIEKEEKASKKAKKDRGQKKENWFKGYGEATKAELEGRIGSSVKRLIKFIGLSIIPIIYAVICILAFWNPIENIGKANVTFIDQEGEVLLATHKKLADDFNGYLVYGDPAAEIPADDTNPDFVSALLESGTNEDGTIGYVQKHDYSLKDKDKLNTRLAELNEVPMMKKATLRYQLIFPTMELLVLMIWLKTHWPEFQPIEKGTINYVYCMSGFNFLNCLRNFKNKWHRWNGFGSKNFLYRWVDRTKTSFLKHSLPRMRKRRSRYMTFIQILRPS